MSANSPPSSGRQSRTPEEHFRLFLLSLAFLSRLGPANQAPLEDMQKSIAYYPLVGATLGLIASLPLCLGLFYSLPLAGAWFYVLVIAWLTRGLHYDGLADLADALGSGKTGEAFWKIVKDSRLGAFGALALALTVAGQIALVSGLLSQRSFWPLILAPVVSRSLPALFASIAPLKPESGLGSIFSYDETKSPFLFIPFTVVLGASLLALPFVNAILALILCSSIVWALSYLATREGGFNGDFLGALIILGEIAFFVGALV